MSLSLLRWCLLASLVLGGCAGLQERSGAVSAGAESALGPIRSGDILVAVDRNNGQRHSVVRLRAGSRGERGQRSVGQHVLGLRGSASALAVSTDGRWLAVQSEVGDEGHRVRVWDLQSRSARSASWTSPAGCGDPRFEPDGGWLVLACDASGRQPSWLLQVALPGFTELALVGERHRRAPAVGVHGDLYWVESSGSRTQVLRRPRGALPFVTHELAQGVKQLWPQADGSVLGELALPGSRRSFVQLLPSGVVRDAHVSVELPRGLERGAPLLATSAGQWLYSSCSRAPCGVVLSSPDRRGTTGLSLSGVPTALAIVPPRSRRVDATEDLATAPASVLATHRSADVAILGVRLGTPLETAFSQLDRAGRHPYWIESKRPRVRPRGIGLGWTNEGHCIEYLADERGVITTVDLQSCAVHYLSEPLRPLLDREHLAEGALPIARDFLGPEAVVADRDGDPRSRGRQTEVVRTRVVYSSAERGYHFEADTEVLVSDRSHLLGGSVWLRLQLPGRRQAAAAKK